MKYNSPSTKLKVIGNIRISGDHLFWGNLIMFVFFLSILTDRSGMIAGSRIIFLKADCKHFNLFFHNIIF